MKTRKRYLWGRLEPTKESLEDFLSALDGVTQDIYDDLRNLGGDLSGTIDNATVETVGGKTKDEVADAVNKRHEQNKDQYLDYGGANQVSASEVKDAVDKRHTQNTDHIIKDADGDTLIDVEESADKDEIVGKVAGVEALRIHASGIIELPKQSACLVYMHNGGNRYSVSASTWTKVPFDTKRFDNANEFDTTNHRFVATEAGFYVFLIHIAITSLTDQKKYRSRLYKNGSGHTGSIFLKASGTLGQSIAGGFIVNLAAGDYVEVFIAGETDFEISYEWGTSLYVAKIA